MLERPHFITIGSMKSATSTLHEQLALQAGIFMSEPKEPCFFSDDEVYARGADWYAKHFAAAPQGAICGESSTHYTKLPTYPETVSRMRRHLRPDIKLVYVLRHPIDRLISQYVHEWSERIVKGPIEGSLETRPELIEYSRYAMQLRPFLREFGPAQILPIFFGEIQAKPQATIEKVSAFVGNATQVAWREGQASANPSAQRLRTSRGRDRLLDAPGLKQIRRSLVPRSARDYVKKFWQMGERPTLSDAKRRALTEVFDADLALLGRWLGIELNCGNFDRVTSQGSLSWDLGGLDRDSLRGET